MIIAARLLLRYYRRVSDESEQDIASGGGERQLWNPTVDVVSLVNVIRTLERINPWEKINIVVARIQRGISAISIGRNVRDGTCIESRRPWQDTAVEYGQAIRICRVSEVARILRAINRFSPISGKPIAGVPPHLNVFPPMHCPWSPDEAKRHRRRIVSG